MEHDATWRASPCFDDIFRRGRESVPFSTKRTEPRAFANGANNTVKMDSGKHHENQSNLMVIFVSPRCAEIRSMCLHR